MTNILCKVTNYIHENIYTIETCHDHNIDII